MARAKRAVEEAEEVKETTNEANCFTVIGKRGEVIRVYSIKIHGEKAKDLAMEFSKKIGATSVESIIE